MANALRKYFEDCQFMFICKGDDPNCCEHPNCFRNGGECHHTADAYYRDLSLPHNQLRYIFDEDHNIWQCTDDINPFSDK